MMNRLHLFALAACVALALPAAHAGKVYKWVDQEGRVHYSDRPTKDAEVVNVKPDGQSEVPPGNDPAAQAKRAEACAAKKKQLEGYKAASAIRETDSLGREREYSPEERNKLIELTEKSVADLCTPPS